MSGYRSLLVQMLELQDMTFHFGLLFNSPDSYGFACTQTTQASNTKDAARIRLPTEIQSLTVGLLYLG